MQSNAPRESVSAEALRRKHESANPAVRWIAFAAGLVVFMMVGSLVTIWFAMGSLSKSRPLDPTAAARGILTTTNQEVLQRFPGPNLQTDPREDLLALRAREQAQLTTYGWADRTNGIVRIPIERTMELILERGLPTRASNAPARAGKSSLELIQEKALER